jgi:predicted DNA-binding protein (UPF0251 family)
MSAPRRFRGCLSDRLKTTGLSTMPDTPQTSDFQRNVVSVVERREAEAHAERLRITSEATMKGALHSSRLIIALIIPFEKIYYSTVTDVARRAGDFLEATSITAADLNGVVRTELESFADRFLSQLPDRQFPNNAARIRGEYRQKFQQSLEGALRDIQIGLIEGKAIAPKAISNEGMNAGSASLADTVILKPTFMGMSIDLLKIARWVWRHVRPS